MILRQLFEYGLQPDLVDDTDPDTVYLGYSLKDTAHCLIRRIAKATIDGKVITTIKYPFGRFDFLFDWAQRASYIDWRHRSFPPVYYLLLAYDNIANVPVANPALVAQWNTYLNLPASGTALTSVSVLGNTVTLFGNSTIDLINVLVVSPHIVSITDNIGAVYYPPVPPITVINYGYLYPWLVAVDVRGIANGSLRVPSDAEIVTLQTYAGGAFAAGGRLKETGLTHWNTPNVGATNQYGFNARGSGYRTAESGAFQSQKQMFGFWSSTSYDGTTAYSGSPMFNNSANFFIAVSDKVIGFAIRLMRDATETELLLPDGAIEATYTGFNGNTYELTKIGTQIWMSQNLAETEFGNGDPIPTVTDNAQWILPGPKKSAYNNDESNV